MLGVGSCGCAVYDQIELLLFRNASNKDRERVNIVLIVNVVVEVNPMTTNAVLTGWGNY